MLEDATMQVQCHTGKRDFNPQLSVLKMQTSFRMNSAHNPVASRIKVLFSGLSCHCQIKVCPIIAVMLSSNVGHPATLLSC